MPVKSNQNTPSREEALQAIAMEIDDALRIGPPVTHIKHVVIPEGQHGLACLESHLLGGKEEQMYSLHEWGQYGDIKGTSIIIPEAPRGFVLTIKKDSPTENELRGSDGPSIPLEAKTPQYTGDYIKIDWIYPHQEIQGLGIPRRYFFAVERAARAAGYPSLHIDATNSGLSYWARKEFDLKIPEEKHASLIEAYQRFKLHRDIYIEQAKSVSPYIKTYDDKELPDDINPSEPHTIPRIFMDILGAIFMVKGGHLHFYKKW